MQSKIKCLSRLAGIWLTFWAVMLLQSCAQDAVAPATPAGYGHVQFRVVNKSMPESRAEVDRLEHLADASKLKVRMMRNGSTIEQTLPLNYYNQDNAEYGLRSEKLGLLAGDYSIIGFFLYDVYDELLITGEPDGDKNFSVTEGGLVVKTLGVAAVGYSKVEFKLVKSGLETKASDGSDYPFSEIRSASIVVRNRFTRQESSFEKLRVSSVCTFGETGLESSHAVCDTLVKLAEGNYDIISYSSYSDRYGRALIETRTYAEGEAGFTVSAFAPSTLSVEVPIKLSKSAEYIKDYIALKEIWEALDGPNWKYYGQEAASGCNWNFNKDIDLWGKQPGVNCNADGRISSINVAGFGIKGNLPDCIGQLTELQVLYLGTHNEMVGGSIAAEALSGEALKAHRLDYHHRTLEKDVREAMSEEMQAAINLDPKQRPVVKNSDRINLKDIHFGIMTNGLTGISKAIKRLTNLQQLYIANSPITLEGFLLDVSPESPFAAEDLSWSDMETLTDIEIYNCPNLTGLPLDMLTGLPEIQALNLANNSAIPPERLKSDWEEIIRGASGDKIQILYLGKNNLREFPEHELLKRMVKLGYLECAYSGIEVVHPFGSGVNPATIILDHNNIREIEPAEDGLFVGLEQLETFSASYNSLSEVPDIFIGRSVYEFSEADFSHNLISAFANGEKHKGINALTINLGYNKFEDFPSQIFKAGSPCEYLIFSGNGIEKIEKGAMTGSQVKRLMSIDLSYNKLSSLPSSDFYASNVPYLYGVDLSYNCFDYFPTEVLDADSMTVLALRHQRDSQGNRTLRQWPTGIYSNCPSLMALYLSSNDIRKVEDVVTTQIYNLEIKDNPNISLTLSASACQYLQYGYFNFIFDKTQDIRGCPSIMQ